MNGLQVQKETFQSRDLLLRKPLCAHESGESQQQCYVVGLGQIVETQRTHRDVPSLQSSRLFFSLEMTMWIISYRFNGKAYIEEYRNYNMAIFRYNDLYLMRRSPSIHLKVINEASETVQ